VAKAGTPCRAAAGICDAAETCTGLSSSCPTDAKQPAGTACRGVAGPCDAPEACTGSSNACPTDGYLPAHTAMPVCEPYTCPGTGVACLTSCTTTADCEPDLRTVCSAGVCVPGKLVFLTSTNFWNAGAFGGIAGADAACQGLADGASLGGTYKAWLSVSGNAVTTRFTHSTVPYVLRGTKATIASNWADLTDGTIGASISRLETGAQAFNPAGVWTGTNVDGTAGTQTCTGWNTQNGSGQTGNSSLTAAGWTNEFNGSCLITSGGTSQRRFYCFEQ